MEAIITAVAENNQPPLPPEHLKGFSSDSEIDEYLLLNPETVRCANMSVDCVADLVGASPEVISPLAE